MMTDRDVWLKAMAVFQAHGTMEAAPVMNTLVQVLGDDPHRDDWARVAAAVDIINESQLQ